MARVVTFGEAMLRLTPPDHERLEQSVTLDATVGGSELNTAVGLSRLGIETAWVSRLPDNPLGRKVLTAARAHGVGVEHVVVAAGERLGLYFVEPGASPRPSRAYYDRAHTAISHITPGEIDWKAALRDAAVFHTSGITPALSETAAETVLAAVQTARELGVTVSFDVNFRARLWDAAKARATFERIFPQVDLLFSTSDDFEAVFDLTGDPIDVARRVRDQFGCSAVILTVRGAPSVLRGTWSSVAVGDDVIRGGLTDLELIDRVGSGDAYDAGFLYGYLKGGLADGVRYGDAMSALKHSQPGDFAWLTLPEVEAFLEGPATKIVR
jgi:2-dehydro-3-deoxygluconokinase